jgi:shikimate kinase
VCADKELRKDLSKILANKLNYLYLDINDMVDYAVLLNVDSNLNEAGNILRSVESDSIKRAMGYEDCIITMSNDLFVANDNFKLLKCEHKVHLKLPKGYLISKIKKDDKYKLEQELIMYNQVNNLIGLRCDVVINKEVKSLQEISNEVIISLNKKAKH